MHGLAPSSLDSDSLARRLRDLAGDERQVQVDFLLHLDEFDRRQEYLPLGFGSLWEFMLRELHLREGAAGRRIAAMKALRRFPRLESPLRDGRLCLLWNDRSTTRNVRSFRPDQATLEMAQLDG